MRTVRALLALSVLTAASFQAKAQPASGPPVVLKPDQLDQLVSRIALYPDPLLAQVLTVSTFPEQIPDAGPVSR